MGEALPKTLQALPNSLAVPCRLLTLKSTDNQGSKPFVTTDQKVEGRQLTSSEKNPRGGYKDLSVHLADNPVCSAARELFTELVVPWIILIVFKQWLAA